jgi:hypothetical protein
MAAIEGRPQLLSEPSARVEGLVVDALAYVDDEVRSGHRDLC